ARVADAVVVAVDLVGVVDGGAVVAGVADAVAVAVGLAGVVDGGAVVASGAEAARDAVAVRTGSSHGSEAGAQAAPGAEAAAGAGAVGVLDGERDGRRRGVRRWGSEARARERRHNPEAEAKSAPSVRVVPLLGRHAMRGRAPVEWRAGQRHQEAGHGAGRTNTCLARARPAVFRLRRARGDGEGAKRGAR